MIGKYCNYFIILVGGIGGGVRLDGSKGHVRGISMPHLGVTARDGSRTALRIVGPI